MHIGKKNLRFSADQYVAILSAYNTTNVSVFFKILEYQWKTYLNQISNKYSADFTYVYSRQAAE